MKHVFPSISFLIPQLKSGDEPAWNALCETFRLDLISKTRFLLRSTGGRTDVNPEDLVQETFLKAWNQRSTFRGDNTKQFASWLLTILRNHFIDCCRRPVRETELGTWFGIAGDADSPSEQMISIESESELHACLAELKPKYQEVINMRIFEGLKFAQIAEQSDRSINTVASIYRRGIEQLLAVMIERRSHESFAGMKADQ
jgi:RNA polymerase sigma-70 factor (ECF subfamily)